MPWVEAWPRWPWRALRSARRLGAPVYTADREWSGVDVGADVRVIR